MATKADARPLRADARRNQDRILDAAQEAFSEAGPYLPLDAIAAELDRRSIEEIERIADGREDVPKAPSPAPSLPPVKLHWRAWHRVEIAPGIELSVAEDAPVHSRELFERAVTVLEAMSKKKEGE